MRPIGTRTKIALQHPVEVDGVVYDALWLRRAKPKDLKAVPFNGSKLMLGIGIAARLCGVPPIVICALNPSDAERVGAEVDAVVSRILWRG